MNSNISTSTTTEATTTSTTRRPPWCRHHWCKHNKTTASTTTLSPDSDDVSQDYPLDDDIYIGEDDLTDDFENKDMPEDDAYPIPIERNEYTTEYLNEEPDFYDTFRAVADARK